MRVEWYKAQESGQGRTQASGIGRKRCGVGEKRTFRIIPSLSGRLWDREGGINGRVLCETGSDS
jgi:hypothetical protein